MKRLATLFLFALIWLLQPVPTSAAVIKVQSVAKCTDAGSCSTSASAITVQFTSTTTAGNTYACSAQWSSSSSTASIADTESNAWTVGVAMFTVNSAYRMQAWYAKNVAGGTTDSITVTLSASAPYFDVHCWEISGASTSSPLDCANSATGSGANPTVSCTTSSSSDLIFGFAAADAGTLGPGSGFTQETSSDGNITESKTSGSPGSTTANFTDTSAHWGALIMTFQAGGAPSWAPHQLLTRGCGAM